MSDDLADRVFKIGMERGIVRCRFTDRGHCAALNEKACICLKEWQVPDLRAKIIEDSQS